MSWRGRLNHGFRLASGDHPRNQPLAQRIRHVAQGIDAGQIRQFMWIGVEVVDAITAAQMLRLAVRLRIIWAASTFPCIVRGSRLGVSVHRLSPRNRKLLLTTKTLLKAMAPAAIIGFSWNCGPKIGASTPAAIGIAATL